MSTMLKRLSLLLEKEELPGPVDDEPTEVVVSQPPAVVTRDPEPINPLLDENYSNPNLELILSSSEDEDSHVAIQKQTRTKAPAILPSLSTHSEELVPIRARERGINSEDRIIGRPAPDCLRFCPIQAISRYPYIHVHGELKESIASRFFASGRFWERVWDV
jgi:hypothetical protein